MSDLRTSSDPRPPSLGGRLYESSTFCRLNDEKRPGLVGLPDFSTLQMCPDDPLKPSETQGIVEGAPPNWFVRVVFDELLDPTVEDLIPQLDAMGKPVLDPTGAPIMLGSLQSTQPVTLTCNGAAVPYSGYYVPNGNSISWPLGPALFVQPVSAVSVPVDAMCEVSVKDMVHNKKGESVPSDQRVPRSFKIAPMELRFSDPDPSDDDPGKIALDPDSPVAFFWTAAFTTMPDPAEITIFSAPNLNVSAANADGDPDTTVCGTGGTQVATADISTAVRGATPVPTTTALIMDLSVTDPDHKWAPTTTYRIEFGANAKITPKQGGPDGTFPTGYSLCFHTTAPAA
jgi:hypothetical protein